MNTRLDVVGIGNAMVDTIISTTKEQIEKCKQVFGDILIQLNYEKDLNW